MIAQRQRQADRQRLPWQRAGYRQQQRPRLPVFELVGKALAEGVDQGRLAVEQNGRLLGAIHAPEPNRRAATGLIGQVSGLAPFQRLGEPADVVMRRSGREDQRTHLKQPLADRRRKSVEGAAHLARHWRRGHGGLPRWVHNTGVVLAKARTYTAESIGDARYRSRATIMQLPAFATTTSRDDGSWLRQDDSTGLRSSPAPACRSREWSRLRHARWGPACAGARWCAAP